VGGGKVGKRTGEMKSERTRKIAKRGRRDQKEKSDLRRQIKNSREVEKEKRETVWISSW